MKIISAFVRKHGTMSGTTLAFFPCKHTALAEILIKFVKAKFMKQNEEQARENGIYIKTNGSNYIRSPNAVRRAVQNAYQFSIKS